MKQETLVSKSFGSAAQAYLTSSVHATGEDLRELQSRVGKSAPGRVLDLGCGAGHASYAVASVAEAVTACDLTEEMLSVVRATAQERGLSNVRTAQGIASSLPFPNSSFDWVVSRYSAHHWQALDTCLREVRRVLKSTGRVLFIDVAGNENPLLDTHLQAVELLRDASHLRDYSESEWIRSFQCAGFAPAVVDRWRIPIDFASWTERIGTSGQRAEAIRTLWAEAPQEVRDHYAVLGDGSFQLDVLMLEASLA